MLKPLTLTVFVCLAAGTTLASSAETAKLATLELRATLYSLALESDFLRTRDAEFVSTNGKILHRASKKFLDDAQVQGSGQLDDGRVVMYAGKDDDGLPHWKVSPHAFAVGASGCALLPFKSVSVDKRVIPLKTKLFIAETKGMVLPDGTIHDGVWYALDTGLAIEEDRIDLFVGAGKAPLEIMKRHGIYHLTRLKVTLAGPIPTCPSEPQLASK
jgi:3D (Asp-Asp-Asp) domain-containing protein